MNRRTLLAAAATTGAGIVAGGAFILGDPPSSDTPETGTLVKGVGAVNDGTKVHELSLTVAYEGEVVHDRTHSLGTTTGENTVYVEDLPDERGTYRMHAALADGGRARIRAGDLEGHDCAKSAFVFIDRNDELSPFLVRPCDTKTTEEP